MSDTQKSIIKKILAVAFFLLVMLLTFYVVFNGQDVEGIVSALRELNGFFMVLALIMALMYIVCEGYMIWMMVGGNWSLKAFLRCTGYSFIGFFYSGITPSASGGQPMQLYYMSRDGLRFSKSCAALTVIAATNKFVLASLGVLLLIFWNGPLHEVFEDHMGWYYLGLIVLVFWVV
ncbi:MAG: lysylphosphatidylglycerol synthase transmembrane domain-containing protein, partial [Lachnospiraceae bacterium]